MPFGEDVSTYAQTDGIKQQSLADRLASAGNVLRQCEDVLGDVAGLDRPEQSDKVAVNSLTHQIQLVEEKAQRLLGIATELRSTIGRL